MSRAATVITRVRPTATDALPPLDPKELEAPYVSHLLGPHASQEDARNVVQPLQERFLCQLESVVIFAYGQTGAGKTHSILGPPGSLTEVALETAGPGLIPSNWGIFPSVALDAYRNLPPRSTLKVSVVEVYMDRVYDLLNNRESVPVSGVGAKAQAGGLYQHLTTNQRDADGKWVNPFLTRKNQQNADRRNTAALKGAQGAGGSDLALYSQPIASEADVAKVSRLIEATRTTVSHKLNERSSRSHCIITLKYSTVSPTTNKIHSASFTFADLAGSERVKNSGVDADAHGGARAFSLKGGTTVDIPASRFDEARNVNSSLASLSRLMVAMAAAKKAGKPTTSHLPWRDSTLNLVLKDCFLSSTGISSGHSSTPSMVLLMAVREDWSSEKETMSTYRFGKVVATTTSSTSQQRTKSVVVGMGRGADNGGLVPVAPSSKAKMMLVVQSFDPSPASATAGGGGQPSETYDQRMERLAAQRVGLTEQLHAMRGTIDEGGVNKEKGANVQKDFLHYQRTLEENQKMEKVLKEQLLEAKARRVLEQRGSSTTAPVAGGSGGGFIGGEGSSAAGEIALLQERIEECKHKVWVNSGLVHRMMTSGCYQAPSKKFVAVQKQLKEVQAELAEFQ